MNLEELEKQRKSNHGDWLVSQVLSLVFMFFAVVLLWISVDLIGFVDDFQNKLIILAVLTGVIINFIIVFCAIYQIHSLNHDRRMGVIALMKKINQIEEKLK